MGWLDWLFGGRGGDVERESVPPAGLLKSGEKPVSDDGGEREMPILRKDENAGMGREASANINALLGKGSEFEGKLTFEGTVRIDGRFSGEIFSEETLVVGEGAKLKAEVSVGTLVLYGELIGNVRAVHAIEAHTPARLVGNIVTPALMIESGVIFEGQCRMENIDVKGEKFPFVKTEPPVAILAQQKKE
jgi:cytoskeletal protein CcmA (bactofilin family)